MNIVNIVIIVISYGHGYDHHNLNTWCVSFKTIYKSCVPWHLKLIVINSYPHKSLSNLCYVSLPPYTWLYMVTSSSVQNKHWDPIVVSHLLYIRITWNGWIFSSTQGPSQTKLNQHLWETDLGTGMFRSFLADSSACLGWKAT